MAKDRDDEKMTTEEAGKKGRWEDRWYPWQRFLQEDW